MFKLKDFFVCVIAGCLVFPWCETFAQQPLIRIQVLTTFDYPGVGNSTTPFGINDRGDITGFFVDANGATRGFMRLANGSFSAPIIEPNDTGNFTRALGINNSRTICGDFFNVADNTFHSYFLSGSTFTQFDVGGPVSTSVIGLNAVGDFVGGFGSSVQPNQAFVDISGNLTVINIAGAANSFGQGINNLNEMVGLYADSGLINHGFFRDAAGTLTFPIDFPGSSTTVLNGINDKRWSVGKYTDSVGVEHGFFLKMPNTFVSFDFPGASGTSLNGINKQGLISGRYTDSSGIRHGFLARVSR